MRIKATMNYVYVGDVPFDVFSIPYADIDYVTFFDKERQKVIFGEFEKDKYTKLIETDADNVDFIYTGEGAIFGNKDTITTITSDGIEHIKNENEKFLDSCCGMVIKENGLLFFPVSGYMFNLEYVLKNKVVAHIYPLPIFFLSTKKHRITATKLLLLFNGIGIADTGIQNINDNIHDIAISFDSLTVSANQRIFKNLRLYTLRPGEPGETGIYISPHLVAIDKRNIDNSSINSVNSRFGKVTGQNIVVKLNNNSIRADKLIDNQNSIIIQSDYSPKVIVATPHRMEVIENDTETLGKTSFPKALCN